MWTRKPHRSLPCGSLMSLRAMSYVCGNALLLLLCARLGALGTLDKVLSALHPSGQKEKIGVGEKTPPLLSRALLHVHYYCFRARRSSVTSSYHPSPRRSRVRSG